MGASWEELKMAPRKLICWLLVAAVALIVLVVEVRGANADAPPEPAFLVYLLQYIAADYGEAIRDGRIIDEFEYDEMRTMSAQLVEGHLRHATATPATRKIQDELMQLRALIALKRPLAEVRGLARGILPRLIESLGVVAHPAEPPDLARGREIFALDCASCHGALGAGDGEAGKGLSPAPTSFRDPAAARLSPHQAFSATTFGVGGTDMASFRGQRTEQQLWDVAFYLMTLREDLDPQRPSVALDVTLQELAAFSDEELLDRLRRRRPQVRPSDLAWYRLNPTETSPRVAVTAPAAARPATSPASPQTSPQGDAAPPDPGLAIALELEDVFGRVAQRVLPSVVGVSSWRRTSGAPAPPSGWSTAGSEADRHPGFELARAGSGFFVTTDGYLLTCHHLLIDPKTHELGALFEVEFDGNLRYRARIIGLEPTVDLAVLKVDVPFATRPATLGDPERVRVGRWAIAVGDPPGVERTFAPGTIAARPERDCYQENRTATLLQTSIRAGSGVYGGPLVDIHGEVIGLSVPPSSMAASIEGSPVFGLPIELATTLYEALKIKESQRSPWLGFSVLELGWQLRRRLPWAPMTGIYIDDVFTPSPASRAGVRVGDVLHAMDGQRMLSVADFQRWLYLYGVGHTVRLEIYREGERLEIEAPIELRPQTAPPR